MSSKLKIERPQSEFPELFVTVPDSWSSIILAPLYDVHLGHENHDGKLFKKHVQWIKDTPNVLSFNGGDLIENASKVSVGEGVYQQTETPDEQIRSALSAVMPIKHKVLFSLPGNHEARTNLMGVDIASWIASTLGTPYFKDYCFCTIRWRGNNFRLLAHHGSGAATTAGAQRMAARKAIGWAHKLDLLWTGHLHNALVDPFYQTDVDQETGLIVERTAMILISPSYLRYFGSYAATKQYPPGHRGLGVVELHADGRIDSMVHANGRRL